MKTSDFKAVIDGLDKNVFKYDHEYASAAIELDKTLATKLTERQSAALLYEYDAFIVHTTETLNNPKEPRFRSHFKFTQGHIDYYSKRLSSKNPLIRQRIADILWEYGGGSLNKGEVGRVLVHSSLEAVDLLSSEELEFERLDCATRALQVARMLNRQPSDLSMKASRSVMQLIESYVADDQVRYTLKLLNGVLAIPNLFTKDELIRCREVSEMGITHFQKENVNFTLSGAFIATKHALSRVIDPKKYDGKLLAKEAAQNQVDEAERRTDSPMVQQHFLTEAEKILKDAGLNDEAHQVRMRVEALGKSEDYEEQFKEFSFETKIPEEHIEELEKLLTKYDDVAAVIAVSPNFIPSWTRSKQTADNDKTTYISEIFTTSTIDENGMVIAIERDDSRKRALRYYQPETELKLTLLHRLLRVLITKNKISFTNFEHQFGKLRIIDNNLYESIKYALELYLQGGKHCYAAALILSTKLEDFMWKLLPIMETEQYIFERDGATQSPKTMGKFLPEMKSFIGDDLYELLNYTLVNKAHLNLRNKIGHGRTHINLDNEIICVRLIQLFSALLIHLDLTPKEHGEDTDKQNN